MPNKKPVLAAIKYAQSKRSTALAEKLGEVALEKENELIQIQEENEDSQYRPSPSKNSVVFVEQTEGLNQLRPKPINLGSKVTAISDGEDEVEEVPITTNKRQVVNDSDDDSNVLKPK